MNKPLHNELWGKIQNFSIDDPASGFPFSKKLAKENNWSATFTNKAIAEYKKFIFFCCISPTGASPSEIVDEVWHLHLTYTDNYWNLFCKQTLQKEIHHHPSKGGTSEKARHSNWYDDTIRLYEEVFGTKPPADIWPHHSQATEEIELDIYDESFFNRTVISFLFATVLFILFTNLFHSKGKDFLFYYMILCVAGLAVIWVMQKHKAERLQSIVDENLPKDFTAFQIARFIYGSHRCYQTALVDLLKQGIIETFGKDYKLVERRDHDWEKETNPLLRPLLDNYKEGEWFTYKEGLGLIEKDTVTHPGLEKLNRLSRKVDYQKMIIPGIVLFIGFARFIQGISNDKPVAFLIMEIGLFTLLSLMILEIHSYTKMVKNVVADFWKQQNADGQGNDIINNFTILGPPAIAGFAEYALLASVFNAETPTRRTYSGGGESGGCGSGSSCSGGGGSSCGGGGCGGCGGG